MLNRYYSVAIEPPDDWKEAERLRPHIEFVTPKGRWVLPATVVYGPPGIGDFLAEAIRYAHLDALSRIWTRITGRPCKCRQRQAWLNRHTPGWLLRLLR